MSALTDLYRYFAEAGADALPPRTATEMRSRTSSTNAISREPRPWSSHSWRHGRPTNARGEGEPSSGTRFRFPTWQSFGLDHSLSQREAVSEMTRLVVGC